MSGPGSDWFAGEVDCDGNELVTIRADELQRLRDEREKFMWQVRDTCARAEKAEAILASLDGELHWVEVFAEVRSQDSQRIAAKVQRGAMQTIAERVRNLRAAAARAKETEARFCAETGR